IACNSFNTPFFNCIDDFVDFGTVKKKFHPLSSSFLIVVLEILKISFLINVIVFNFYKMFLKF
ncbi:MAG TPA: hypothetical protein PK553_03175, partial [Defluviitoga tunisiensis]|nr:hypothetical protein [Defluviitoga tunisiensis]